MRTQFVIPVLASILILGTIGFSQEADAVIVKFLFKMDKNEFGDNLFGQIRAVSVDPNTGNILGLDRGGFIQVFDSSGQFLFRFGSSGNGVGQLSQPFGLTVHPDSSNVIVAELGSHEVSVFDSTGNFLFKFGSTCHLLHPSQQGCVDPDGLGPLEFGDGQFSFPSDVAVDSNTGNIVVADKDNDRIQVFDSTGNFLFKSAQIVNNPFGIAVDPNSGNILVAFGNIVSVLDSNGEFLFRITSTTENDLSEPFGVTVDPFSSQIFVADTIPGTSLDERDIQVYDSSGNFLYKFGTSCDLRNNFVGCVDPDGPGPLELGDGQFGVPVDVDIDPNTGHVITGDSHLNRIQVFEIINEPPEIIAELQAIKLSATKGLFQVQLTVTDDTDPNPTVLADINGIPVTNGQLVNLVPGDILTAIATDDLGNQASTNIAPSFSEISLSTIKIIGNIDLDLKIGSGQTLIIDGTVNGDIKANGGEVIINRDSVINGDVKVNDGAKLTILGGTVSGDVNANDCMSLRIFSGAPISGDVNVRGCETVSVSNNNVNGDVDIKNNTSVTVTSNTINGDLTIKNNTTCTERFNFVTGTKQVIGCTFGGGGGGI